MPRDVWLALVSVAAAAWLWLAAYSQFGLAGLAIAVLGGFSISVMLK